MMLTDILKLVANRIEQGAASVDAIKKAVISIILQWVSSEHPNKKVKNWAKFLKSRPKSKIICQKDLAVFKR